MTVDEVIKWLRVQRSLSPSAAQYDKANDALCCVKKLQAENARLSQAAEPEAVEPKDQPDESSVVWSRNGETYLFGWCDDSRTERVAFIDERGRHNGYTYDLPRGNWLPCTVTVPPAKEPEAKPARPPLLLAKIDQWAWMTFDGENWNDQDGNSWQTHHLTDVDESASDHAAVEVWRRETK